MASHSNAINLVIIRVWTFGLRAAVRVAAETLYSVAEIPSRLLGKVIARHRSAQPTHSTSVAEASQADCVAEFGNCTRSGLQLALGAFRASLGKPTRHARSPRETDDSAVISIGDALGELP
jgi:hypothetical protein